MRIYRRPLAPREIDHELVWLSVTIGAAVLVVFWRSAGLPWPQCIFHHVTGEPCLTCGATRAAIALFHGNFPAAFALNPLATFAMLAAIALNVYAVIALVCQAGRLRFLMSARAKFVLRMAVVVAMTANWIYLFERGLV